MKKIILVSLVAVMLTSFTACTKKEEPKDKITFKSYIEDTLPEETTTEATETEVPEETTAPEATEETPDSSSLTTFKKETYSFKIDETKWFGVMDYLEATNYDDVDAAKLDALRKNVEENCDAAYYLSDLSGTNFIVQAEEVGEQASEVDLSDNIIA